MNVRFLVGHSAHDRRNICVDEKDLRQHALIVGSSGSGKSRLIENMIRQIAEARPRRGALLLDPHGSSYENLKRHFANSPALRKRVLLFDVNDESHYFGLNVFQRNGLNIDDQVSQIIRSVSKVAGDELDEAAPRRERWERNTFLVAVKNGLTWPDLPQFLRNDKLKMNIVDRAADIYLHSEWSELCGITRVQDRWTVIEAVLNRTRKFVNSHTSLIFGQPETTIPIRRAMDEGLIVLVNLLPRKVSQEISNMIGVLLCDSILNAAIQRTPEVSRPFYFFIDECGEMSSPDLPRFLNALRKFGVSCIFACQELAQLKRKGDERLYQACLTDCHTKLIFSTSYADSVALADELFVGKIRGDRIKHRNKRTMLMPKETTRTIKGSSWMESESEADSDGFSSGDSTSTTDGFSATYSKEIATSLDATEAPRAFESCGHSTARSYGDSSSSFSSRTRSRSSAHGESETIVPFYEYLVETEETGRDYYSVEETKEKFRSWIVNLRQRLFQFKVRGRPPVLTVAPDVPDAKASRRMIRRLEAGTTAQYCLPRETVEGYLEERKQYLLDLETGALKAGFKAYEGDDIEPEEA